MAPTYQAPGVYVEEVDKGSKPIALVGTAVAAFIGFARKGPVNTATLVTNWTQFVEQFGDFMPGSFLAHSVYGYFNNGGGRCYIVRIGASPEAAAASAPSAALPSRSATPVDTLRITALGSGEAAQGISVEVAEAGSPAGGDGAFKLIVRKGSNEETFDNLTFRRRPATGYVEAVVNDPTTGSKFVRVADLGATSVAAAERLPSLGIYNLAAAPAGALAPAPILAVAPTDFAGSAPERSGMGGLEVADDVTMVCAPDLMAAYQAGMVDMEGIQAVQTAMIDHCQKMKDRVAILDAPPGMKPQEIENWRKNVVRYDSSYAALYYPWIKVFDPVAGKSVLMPPSGHMAGIWARNDATRGVHKAPANEVVGGALDVEFKITKGEQEGLNPAGINCIRAFPGRGIRVWGARTLSSNPSWNYLNVRRLFNMVEKSIDNGTQWVVFEPNDLALWQRINRSVTAFLTIIWRSGALFGATPQEAFYVKCDAETNPPEARDLGIVTTEIGIAPVKPAEFVVFRISQWRPGA
ncbi:MAG: phage tail sheath family protein [SAR202 cluster bacterium]|nr:phage tail sheath family protein [SAR202 cluster bacterium]